MNKNSSSQIKHRSYLQTRSKNSPYPQRSRSRSRSSSTRTNNVVRRIASTRVSRRKLYRQKGYRNLKESRPKLYRQKGYRNLEGLRRIRLDCVDDNDCNNNFKCHPTNKICIKQHDTYAPIDYNRTQGKWYITDRGHLGYIQYPSHQKERRKSNTKQQSTRQMPSRKITRRNTHRPRQRNLFNF